MGNTAWVEVRLVLAGTWRLARGDRSGLSYFDRSLDGFWRSFRAAVISYPIFLVLLTMQVSVEEWERAGGWRIVSAETIGYVVSWVAFPLLMLPVARYFGRAHRFFDFMVPYNWCQLPLNASFLLLRLVFEGGILAPRSDQNIGIISMVVTLIYELYVWYLARVALDTTVLAAIFIALLDLVLSVVISQVTLSFYLKPGG
jgi:hypothetical protein